MRRPPSTAMAGSALASAVLALTLAGCGGHGSSSDSTEVRLVNGTTTHASLSLLADSSTVVAATAADSASDYASTSSGSPTLQVDDAGNGATLSTLSPSLSGDKHYTLLAYEIDSSVRTVVFADGTSQPNTGTTLMRVFDAATEAGALDVYVGDPSATLTSPTFTIAASTGVQTTSAFSFTPGTYRIRVTAAGNNADVRLDMPSVTLADRNVETLLLTPTVGGTLVNGAVAVEQGGYTPGHNTSARVRLAGAVSGGAALSASAGATAIAAGALSPSVGAYTLVPAAAPLTVSVNGSPIASPAQALAAGSDDTLLVYGDPGTATASVVVDDNRLPALGSNLKLRLLDGLTGAATPLTLTADFGLVAANVAPGTASSYATQAADTNARLEVMASNSQASIYTATALSLPGGAVYTLFMLGDASAPSPLLRKDR